MERDYLKNLGVEKRTILKWIFKWDGGMYWTHLAQDRGEVAGSCECGNEPLASIKRGEIS
jgi:hypothetical protein